MQGGEGSHSDPRVAVPVNAVLLALFAWAVLHALGWPKTVGLLPLVAAVPAVILTFAALWCDVRLLRGRRAGPLAAPGEDRFDTRAALFFLFWTAGIVVGTILVGQLIALPAFMALYLLVRGDHSWKLALGYAAAGWAFLYFMFDRIIAVVWYPSYFFQ